MHFPFAHTSVWVALLTGVLVTGCAQSNADIDRVQPNALRKAELLDGQWFLRNTITWAPFNTSLTFPGMTGAMEKLVWEIQENYLVGYRSYPHTLGLDRAIDDTSQVAGTTTKQCNAKGECQGGHQYYGAPVVAFPIESHFDIQRGYNPATGEPTNVISENTSDRPWNERAYMRVQWAANVLNSQFGRENPIFNLNALHTVSNANWIHANEPDSDSYDWPTFEYRDRNGDGISELVYFDVTGRYMAHPLIRFVQGFGTVPLCYLVPPPADCASSEIRMRISVAKVDELLARDYEPLQYGDELMTLFGYFRTERLNYNRKFGYTNDAIVRLADRHRVWQEYYKKDKNGQPTTLPIPMEQRREKPIVYYLTPAHRMGGEERYAEFSEPAQTVASAYDDVFRRAIAAAKGGNERSPHSVEQMFYVCNNPVRAGDPKACGPEGLSPKFGDLRYNFIHTTTTPMFGLLGYGPSSPDPETGQIISGVSNTYAAPIAQFARRIMDWALILNGERNITSYISGKNVRDYIESSQVYNVKNFNKRLASIQSALQGVSQKDTETKGAFQRRTPYFSKFIQGLQSNPGQRAAGKGRIAEFAAKLAQHPRIESLLLDNPEVQKDLVGLLPPFARAAAEKDATFRRNASRNILINFPNHMAYEKHRRETLSKNNILTAENFDRTLIATAKKIQKRRALRIDALQSTGDSRCATPQSCTEGEAKRLVTDEILRTLRQQIWLAVTLHEVGHTVNLRHNFQGSFDALNYFDEYWDIRKSTLTVTQDGSPKVPRTPADMKAVSIGTAAQHEAGLFDYAYSSIMDYSGKMYTDLKGLGKYDSAAILFAYSGGAQPGYVEVFKDARVGSKTFPSSDGNKMTISGAGDDLPLVNAQQRNTTVRNYPERYHYSTVPLHFGKGQDLASVIDDGIDKLRAHNRKLARWEDVQAAEERVREIIARDPRLLQEPDRAANALGKSFLRVPYMFCADESADGPILSCNRFDRGADYFEMAQAELEDDRINYYDTHFRRDRAFFSAGTALVRTLQTYNFLANIYRHWVLEQFREATHNQEQLPHAPVDPLIQDYWTMAVLDGVNANLNVLTKPENGLYGYGRRRTAQGNIEASWWRLHGGVDFDSLNATGRQALEAYFQNRYGFSDFTHLPRGLGRRQYSSYDFKSGFGFFGRLLEVGQYNAQIAAIYAAVGLDSNFYLQGVDIDTDINRYTIDYFTVFGRELQTTFNAIWSIHTDVLNPMLYKTLNDNGTVGDDTGVIQRVFVKGENYIQDFNYPPPLPHNCQENEKPPGCWATDQHIAPVRYSLTWTSRINSLIWGMYLFRKNFDLDFAKSNQIFKLASGEALGLDDAFKIGAGYHTVEVQNSTTGHRYLAIEADGATEAEATAAVRMVRRAQAYAALAEDPTTCPMPTLLAELGERCMSTERAQNPDVVVQAGKSWRRRLDNQLQQLEIMRDIYKLFGRAL